MNDKSEHWCEKASCCNCADDGKHSFQPVAWKIQPASKHVSMMMCMKCFYAINIEEAFEHGVKLWQTCDTPL